MTTFPPELIEIIVYEVWHSGMLSYIRTSFMTNGEEGFSEFSAGNALAKRVLFMFNVHLLNFSNIPVLLVTADINRYYPAPHRTGRSASFASYVKIMVRSLDATTP